MKKIEIDTKIEDKVEEFYSLAVQINEIAKQYPECWKIIREQFNLQEYQNRDLIPDDIDHVKIRLYVAIIREKNKKTKKIQKELINKKL
jgi:hypothetical protein|tara:strand:+ start:10441 stop:10707 length:267 start_codon:yes stop_codon:yes gene_type:complete